MVLHIVWHVVARVAAHLPSACSPAGTDGIIKKIRETVGDKPVYLSIDVRSGQS